MLAGIEREFRDDPVVVVGVHSPKFPNEGDLEAVRDAARRYGVTHPVVVDTGHMVWDQYAVRAWPTLYVVDPDGYVCAGGSGEPDPRALSRVVRELLETYRAKGTLAHEPLPLRPEPGAGGLLRYPSKVSVDGERIVVTDTGHHRLMLCSIGEGAIRVDAAFGGPDHGFVDGPPETARFSHPYGTAIVGDDLWVADAGNHAVRRVDLRSRETVTVAGTGVKGGYPPAGGPGPQTALRSPWDVAWDAERGLLYIAMAGSHQIWAYDASSGEAAPFAGSGAEARMDGHRTSAAFAQPSGLAVLADKLYVADSEISSIREVDLRTGRVRTVCGGDLFDFGDRDGVGDQVRLQHPMGIAADPRSGAVWIADSYNHKIKRVYPTTGGCVTMHGNGLPGAELGRATGSVLAEPEGLAVGDDGSLVVADTNNHRLVRVADGTVSGLLG